MLPNGCYATNLTPIFKTAIFVIKAEVLALSFSFLIGLDIKEKDYSCKKYEVLGSSYFLYLIIFSSLIGYYIGITQVNQKEIFRDWQILIPISTLIGLAIGMWRRNGMV
ncbi:MAG: hypothetical protein ACXW1A_03480 [Nitrososphaeraceae archaeon]